MVENKDTYRHKGLRARLVQEIAGKGVKAPNVLHAINSVPRHLFIESSFINFAYQDKPFPIGWGQTISQPYTVAFQSELLNVLPGERILEVGTGSGYQAAVLYELGAKVYSIERFQSLYERTSRLMNALGYQMELFLGDGYKGLPQLAPFDKIIVTAGASVLPTELLKQLKIGGVMVIPLGAEQQIMTRFTRLGDEEFKKEEFGMFAFVPMLKGIVK